MAYKRKKEPYAINHRYRPAGARPTRSQDRELRMKDRESLSSILYLRSSNITMSLFQQPVLRQSLCFERAFHLIADLFRKVFQQFNFARARNAPRPRKADRHDFLYTARSSRKKNHAVTEQNRLVQAMSYINEGPSGLLPNTHEFRLQHLTGLGIQ